MYHRRCYEVLLGCSRSAEVNQRFDDPILFGPHHAERPLDLLETELVGGHRGGVDLSGLHEAEDAAEPLAPPGHRPP